MNLFQYLGLIALTLALSACSGPFIFMSGGELSGAVQQPPAQWTFEESSALAQLETRPEDPYSINLAYVQMNGQLYIYAGDTRTNWVQHIEQNPFIRIRVGETIYPVKALRVEDKDELTAFAAEWAGRSFFQRDPMQFDEVWLYRLESR